ncbi:hypothetical protein EVAR_36270_1 [Eumeta japonica]|uniref:Uncharacterized protein n=1 Tax=Eumeta variegata TaxID=151549 RepID=A0A4C1WVJ5_EUMVA|nr:hypothetical protein EVAR_36270_1 [Eumeta japonica]
MGKDNFHKDQVKATRPHPIRFDTGTINISHQTTLSVSAARRAVRLCILTFRGRATCYTAAVRAPRLYDSISRRAMKPTDTPFF